MSKVNLNRIIEMKYHEVFDLIMGGKIPININLSPDVSEINAEEKDIEQMLIDMAIHAEHNIPDIGKLTISTENITIVRGKDEASSMPGQESYVGISFSYEINKTKDSEKNQEYLFDRTINKKCTFEDVHGLIERIDGYLNIHHEGKQIKSYNILIPALLDNDKNL